MNEKALKTLEFDKVLALLADEASSAPGRELCLGLTPMSDIDLIRGAQDQTADAFSRIVRKGNISFPGLSGVDDIRRRLSVGASLNMAELLLVARLLDIAAKAKEYGRKEDPDEPDDSLSALFSALEPLSSLYREITRRILAEDEMSDEASPELRRIRRQLASMNDRIHEALGKIINGPERSSLQDPVITQRNGRYCIPVRLEYKARIPGMVHDQSASGSTLFIEPMSVVRLNNECRELAAEEQKEIERILASLSEQVSLCAEAVQSNFSALSTLDFIFAKGKLALSQNASRPLFNESGFLRIRQGRHPLLDPSTVVPIDLELGRDFHLLIVTGPNTGGKTVSLKTAGLFTIMGEAGLHIPASDRSELAVFPEVYADIGDEQSIEQSLSTFSAHMTNIVGILKNVREDSLVLFDELGAGTDPTEGAALAISILSHLRKKGVRTMATTHYSELKVYALQTEGVCNASCEFNVETLLPTYRILIGVPGKSNAFAISRRLGLPDELIEDAKAHLKKQDEDFEDLLTDLEMRRVSMEKQQEELRREKESILSQRQSIEKREEDLLSESEAMLEKSRAEAARILQEAKDYADETIRNFRKFGKNNISSADMEREREKLRKKIKDSRGKSDLGKGQKPHKEHAPGDFKVGDTVKVHSMNVKGTVLSLPDAKGSIQVQMGIIRTRVPYTDLEILPDTEITGPGNFRKTGSGGIKISKSMGISREINLLGMTVDEAVAVLDKYLDDAALAHLNEVRIVHGKGTGALRKGVQEYLRKAKHVKSFRMGNVGEGDTGVTIAELK